MNFKKLFITFFVLFASVHLIAEDFNVNRLTVNSAYYKPPFSISLDYEKRLNDFAITVPLFNLTMDTREDFQLLTAPGITVQYKNIWIGTGFDYELYTPDYDSFSDKTEYCGNLTFGISSGIGAISFRSEYGNKRWFNEADSVSCEKEFSESINISMLIYDNLIIKNYCESLLQFHVLPEKDFSSYSLTFNVPFQYNWYYGESCAIGSIFYTERLNNNEQGNNFLINKSYESLTGRISLGDNKTDKYKLLSSFEIEQRLYIFRCLKMNNNFYLSAFGNMGFGIKDNGDLNSLYQYGLGLGYTMFGCVPFTFQVGCNNKNEVIMYLNVVSKIIF